MGYFSWYSSKVESKWVWVQRQVDNDEMNFGRWKREQTSGCTNMHFGLYNTSVLCIKTN